MSLHRWKTCAVSLLRLQKKEMDYLLTEYWLAEAEEWKQLKDSAPFIEKNCEARSRHGD